MREAIARAERVAPHRVAVLLAGESGTGKELFARLIHERRGRNGGAFVAVNCAALPKELLESELFGHERGAFTGAAAMKAGAFERANGGTLFLDEIGELAPEHQAKLLRAIQEHEVVRLGGTRPIRLDVRIVAATNRDLWERANQGDFREDLYYRVAGYRLTLPPLRSRGRDVLTLAAMLLKREFPDKSFSRAAQARMLRHPWHGNVRELENVVRAAAIDSDGPEVGAVVLGRHLRVRTPVRSTSAAANAGAVVAGLLRQHERLSAGVIQAALGVGKTQRHRVLAALEEQGAIVRRGCGRGTYYVAGGAAG